MAPEQETPDVLTPAAPPEPPAVTRPPAQTVTITLEFHLISRALMISGFPGNEELCHIIFWKAQRELDRWFAERKKPVIERATRLPPAPAQGPPT
jgi:hypothetical protein